ncbi:MAG: ABC transporter ATP-binding protein [Eggerthellaceae bacterium]|nr:ABC transporter ATP-binding protein [Eggerthellaceae bacterium]
MPEAVNTSLLDRKDRVEKEDSRETMIKVENVSMVFNMASERLNSLKEYAIKIVRRELSFEGLRALDNVSFEVKKGDVFGIIGTNGSGKSTMLKIIAGVLEPTEGSCTINGSIAPLIELGAGFDQELTARENIFLNGALLGYSREFVKEHFTDIVAFAEIERFLDMPMKNYSSGMIARVAFAVATVIVPEILIVDEVLAVGDFMFQKKCENRINELIEKHGVTVLIVSHSNDQIERLCNKVIWIEKGHARMMGDVAEVCQTYRCLGGRIGSASSEARVLSAINEVGELADDAYSVIAGEDFFDTAVLAASAIWKDKEVETVAIACADHHINTVLANGLAGAFGGPVLQSRINRVPDCVQDFLEAHKPKRILFFDWESHASLSLERLGQLDWQPEVIGFTNPSSLYALSKDIFAYGEKEGLWGKTAVALDFEDNPESLAVTPFIYKEKCPVFASTLKGRLDAEELSDLLAEKGIERLVLIGKTADKSLIPLCEKKGIKTLSFASQDSCRCCIDICEWDFSPCKDEKRELCIASMMVGSWIDILMGGPYCAQRNTSLLLMDPTNLDSIAGCLDFVARNKESIEGLSFFGGSSNLGDIDRELLYRELS